MGIFGRSSETGGRRPARKFPPAFGLRAKSASVRPGFGARRARRAVCLAGGLLGGFAGVAAQDYLVDFENETKGSYTTGTIALSGLDWELTEALLGATIYDRKNGVRAMRMQRSGDTAGEARMLEDKTNGIGRISFLYARYHNDTAQPPLLVEYSADAGATWTQAGVAVTDFPDTLTEWAAVVNVAESARIRLRTDLGGDSGRRFNIDDLLLSDPGDGPPVVTTAAIGAITPASASAGGEVVAENGAPVSARGVVWNLTGAPTTNDNVVAAGAGTGEFTVGLTNLTAGRVYFARAYAINELGAGYGMERDFTAACFTNAPFLRPVTNRHSGGFSASWERLDGATGYLLDVAFEDRFHPGGITPLLIEEIGATEGEPSIAQHHAGQGFDNSAVLEFNDGGAENAADIRSTQQYASTGYTNAAGRAASGAAHVFFSGTEGDRGFGIDGIDTRGYAGLELSFGYLKGNTLTNAAFTVEWSRDGGATWNAIDLTGRLPPPQVPTGWYLIETPGLPPAAENAVALGLRWIKSGTVSMRIDDILLRGDGGASTLHPRYRDIAVAGTDYRVERIANGVWFVRVRAVGTEDCFSPPSDTRSVEVGKGGTVVIFK